jgi:hypothetical protein
VNYIAFSKRRDIKPLRYKPHAAATLLACANSQASDRCFHCEALPLGVPSRYAQSDQIAVHFCANVSDITRGQIGADRPFVRRAISADDSESAVAGVVQEP